MSKINIKIESSIVAKLKSATGEVTSHKAVEKAFSEFLKFSSRLNLKESLSKIDFKPGFDPLKLRKSDR